MTSPTPVPGFVIGLTGGIGSGKSAAADRFAALGAAVIDTDAIAHELTAPNGAAIPDLAAAFGPGVLASDGSLDRAVMRRLAFAEPEARLRLEAILHPLIRQASLARCRQAAESVAPYVVLVVPLLVESGGYGRVVDRVVVVDCADETRIARVSARSGLLRGEIERIMAAQASRQDRLAAAVDVIDNNGDLAQLTRQVDQLHEQYAQIAGKLPKPAITG